MAFQGPHDGARDDPVGLVVLVLNGSWLYTMTKFVPPLKDYSFDVSQPSENPRVSKARHVILFSGRGPVQRVRAELIEAGMRLRSRVKWKGGILYIFDRPRPESLR